MAEKRREKRVDKLSKPKKKKQTTVYAAIAVGVIIVALSIFFVYSNDQAKERGKAFGKALEFIQDDLRKLTHSFDSKVSMSKQGDISKEVFLEFAEKHEREMEKIILRYDNLQTPQQFKPAVELFKLSAETEFEANKYVIEWIRTDDETALIRSDSLYEQSLQYEQAALLEFNLVQRQTNP
jgi:hypothetical protein